MSNRKSKKLPRTVWYRIAIFIPVLVPLTIAVAAQFIHPHVNGVLLYFGGQFFFTPAYLVFALCFLYWAHGKTGKQIENSQNYLPFIFAPFCVVQMFVLAFLHPSDLNINPKSMLVILGMGIGFGVLGIVFGWVYVALVWMLTEMFEKFGIVEK